MPEPDPIPIPQSLHDAAADWVERRQRDPSDATAERLKAWLAADAKHRVAFQMAQRNWDDGLLLGKASRGQDRALVRAPFLMRQSTHRMMAGIGGAAALAVAVVVVAPMLPSAVLIPAAQAQRFETRKGEIKRLTLADGTVVTLDTASRIDIHGAAKKRVIELQTGRARFAPAAGGTLEVVVAGAHFQAEDATFDVDLTDAERSVAVLSGRVDVQADGATQPTSLSAGSALRGTHATPSKGDVAAQQAWPHGMLALDDTHLDRAVAAINRYNDVQIALAEPTLSDLRLTGAFKVRDPAGFARTIAAMYHLRLTKTGSVRLTLSRDGRASVKKSGG